MNLLGKMIGFSNRPNSMIGIISKINTIQKQNDYLLDVCPDSNIISLEMIFDNGLVTPIWPFVCDHGLGIMTKSGWMPLWEVI